PSAAPGVTCRRRASRATHSFVLWSAHWSASRSRLLRPRPETCIVTESIYSRTLSREDLDEVIDLWLLPVLNAQALSDVTREVKEMEEFKALFRVEEPNAAVRRAAVDFYHKTSMK